MTIKTQFNKSTSSGLSRARSSAFTLIELLVSLVIILLMVVAAASIEARYTTYSTFVKHDIQAQNLAENCMNKIRQKRDANILNKLPPFQDMDDDAKIDVICSPLETDPAGTINNIPYTITVTVQ